jgi:anaerobic magnesium-protoporphyrin IX monomethyl ester cyclase
VACALGVESADPRVLDLIDKGAPIEAVSNVITHLADAGVAAEAMCFTDFPTETAPEASRTLEFLHAHQERLGVFIVGEFGLTHGALVAQSPERFGIEEIWQLEGDELGLSLFYEERTPSKTDRQRRAIDDELGRVSSAWLLRHYPWAGAVSTTHTILYYDRFGPGVFRTLARSARRAPDESHDAEARFNVRAAMKAQERERAIWSSLVYERRAVSRPLYEELSSRGASLRPSRSRVRYAPGALVTVVPSRRKNTRPNALG